MAGVIGFQQGHAAFGLIFRNLTEHILGKLMLEFAEGGHAIVDAIEQNKDPQSGERTDAESDEQTLDQTRAN